MRKISVLDRILLLATALLSAYQIAVGIEGLGSLAVTSYTIAFGVLLVASLILIILGFEALESPLVVAVAALIPLSLSLGLISQYVSSYQDSHDRPGSRTRHRRTPDLHSSDCAQPARKGAARFRPRWDWWWADRNRRTSSGLFTDRSAAFVCKDNIHRTAGFVANHDRRLCRRVSFSMMERLERWKPALPRAWLYLLSGLMWSGVGLMLCFLAYGWLLQVEVLNALLLTAAGVLLGTAIYRFGFLGLAIKNINRIRLLPAKACLFAFQEWKSYPLIAVMIMLGITLRHSPIPKSYLAVLYIGIGLGLFLASLQYYLSLVKRRQQTLSEQELRGH
jgi:hypothetical protein